MALNMNKSLSELIHQHQLDVFDRAYESFKHEVLLKCIELDCSPRQLAAMGYGQVVYPNGHIALEQRPEFTPSGQIETAIKTVQDLIDALVKLPRNVPVVDFKTDVNYEPFYESPEPRLVLMKFGDEVNGQAVPETFDAVVL